MSSQTNHSRRQDSIPVIQPVTRAVPATQQCYEDSSVPLSVTITPNAPLFALEQHDEVDKTFDKGNLSRRNIQSLSRIPKCYHCGAPHANDHTFVESSQHSPQLYCLLCHQVFMQQPHDSVLSPPNVENDEVGSVRPRQPSASADTHVFALPLRLPQHQSTTQLSYSIPALQCPVLWYICIDGGTIATSSGYQYWEALATALQRAVATAPSHVHVALLIASQVDDMKQEDDDTPKTLVIYDLYSAVPKLHRYSSDELAATEDQLLSAVLHSAVPVSKGRTTPSPNLAAALRSLMDYPHSCYTSSAGTTTKTRCPVGWVTEVVVAALAHGAIPAGQRSATETTASSLLPYAGVKLSFFLADRPAGLSGAYLLGWSLDPTSYQTDFVGGWGGHITTTAVGERYGVATEPPPKSVPGRLQPATELTPPQLMDRYHLSAAKQQDLPNYYADLGRQCANVAMGVDLLLLFASSSSSASSASPLSTLIPDFCLPLYLPLAERSGAPGPLIFDLSIDDSDNSEEDHHTRFQREVVSRTPWQPGRVFGAELRVRVSPGWVVDPTTVSVLPEVPGPQLAPIYNEDGLIGPASSVDASAQLWRMGTTDCFTSFTLDLALQHKHVRDRVYVDGFGEIHLHPVIQVCFAYTTIESETDPNTGRVTYQTVRQMRISSRRLSLAYTVEALYATIDTEALAVVLFHRIALASFQDGVIEAANMAQHWLQSLMVCVYQSALEQLQIENRYHESGIAPDKHDLTHRYFYPGERLLYLEGELSAEDVLLAQGHERLRPLVLMVYLLLQSDPLRLSAGFYRPSLDFRSAALSQMTSMTPSALTRCIAPRLQLWESGEDIREPIWEVLDLRSDAVQTAILECTSTHPNNRKGSTGLILFLDTPEQIVVMDARSVIQTTDDAVGSPGIRSNGTLPHRSRNTAPLVMGVGLRNAVEDAALSYRTRPRIVLELQASQGERTLLRLVDHLIEDTAHAASSSESFADWKTKIAREVQLEIENLASS